MVVAGVDAVGVVRPTEGNFAVEGVDAVVVAVGIDVAAVDRDIAVACADTDAVYSGGGDSAAVDGNGDVGVDAVVGYSGGGDAAAVDGDKLASDTVPTAIGDDSARAVRLAVDGKLAGIDGDAVGGAVRDGEGCAVAEDQAGVAKSETPADRDVGGDDVPGFPTVVIRDVGGRVCDDCVVGAYLPVAVRVDVGHEVGAERLAREDGAIDRALVDGCAVGEQLPAIDGDGAGVGIVAVGVDAVGGVRPTEGDVAVGVDAVFAAGGGDIAAVDGHGDAAVDAKGVPVGGDAAAVDGHAGGGDAVLAAGGDKSACAACLAVEDEIARNLDGGAVPVRDGEDCAVAEDQVGAVVGEGELSSDGDGVGDDVPVLRVDGAVLDVACGVSEDGVQVALALHAVRIQVGDGGHGRPQRLARDVGAVDPASVGVVAVSEPLAILDADATEVAAGVDAVDGVRPAEGDGVG